MSKKKKPKAEVRANLPVIRVVDTPIPDSDSPSYEKWIDAAVWRMGEIERMAGRRMPMRHAAALTLEHMQLGMAVAGSEQRRLQIKQITMEHALT